MEENKEEQKVKKVKKQGPIRTGIIVPFLIVVGLIVGFNILFLDTTIKKVIEVVGAKINGAQVDVAEVQTSFKELSFIVKEIEMTDKINPDFNKIVLGEFKFVMLWDALLRGKIVIDNSEIANIRINTKRKSRGHVPPPEPPSDAAAKKTQELLNKTKEEFKGNVFGDIASILSGTSTQDAGKNIQGDLASKKGFEKLKTEIAKKQKEMDQKLAAVPNTAQLNSLQTRLKGIPWSQLKDVTKAPKILKQADQLKKDIESANRSIQEANKAVQSNVATIQASYSKAQNLVKEDIKNISTRMKLPSLDPKQIARMLFGNDLLKKIEEVKKYQQMAKKYMPKKSEESEEDKITPPKRGVGTNYSFGTPNSYPLFWLKIAKIDSKNDQGFVKGKIENVTSDQTSIGKLTTGLVEADFPAINYRKIKADIELDHRKKAILKVNSEIGSFPITDRALSDSKDVKFILKKANTNTKIKATATQENINLSLNNKFSSINYETSAKSPQVNTILKTVSKRTKVLTLNAKGNGPWNDIKFDINSNLAKAIQSATQSLIQEKINAAKAKIKADIEGKIAKSKQEVEAQINSFKSKYEGQLNDVKNKLAKTKNDLNSQKKAAEKKAKEGAKDLLKNIKGIKGLKGIKF